LLLDYGASKSPQALNGPAAKTPLGIRLRLPLAVLDFNPLFLAIVLHIFFFFSVPLFVRQPARANRVQTVLLLLLRLTH